MLRTLIIEDEPDKRESLKLMLAQVCPDEVDVVGEAEAVPEAVALIGRTRPDLVFLDVEIRLGTGFNVLSQLQAIDFAVIFTTAYSQYAADAFRYEAVDYLVKPVRSSLLREAVDRVRHRQAPQAALAQLMATMVPDSDAQRFAIATEEAIELVDVADIVRCEGQGSYTTYVLADGRSILASGNLGGVEARLKDRGFMKVHQSHLVNQQHVVRFLRKDGGALQMSDGDLVPVSRRLKPVVQAWMDQL